MRPRGPGCADITFSAPNWTVAGLDFRARQQLAAPGARDSSARVSFNLSNPAAGYATPCSATSDRPDGFLRGDAWHWCDDGSAAFRFSMPRGELAINQTWTCQDGSDSYVFACLLAFFVGFLLFCLTVGPRVYFLARGNATIPLHCNDTLWLNSNWKLGETYSLRTVQCDKASFMVPWNEIEGFG